MPHVERARPAEPPEREVVVILAEVRELDDGVTDGESSPRESVQGELVCDDLQPRGVLRPRRRVRRAGSRG